MTAKIGLNLRKPFTKSLGILDSSYIMPAWKPWGYRWLYKSVVTELLTRLWKSVNLISICNMRLTSFPGSAVISLNLTKVSTKILSFA